MTRKEMFEKICDFTEFWQDYVVDVTDSQGRSLMVDAEEVVKGLFDVRNTMAGDSETHRD